MCPRRSVCPQKLAHFGASAIVPQNRDSDQETCQIGQVSAFRGEGEPIRWTNAQRACAGQVPPPPPPPRANNQRVTHYALTQAPAHTRPSCTDWTFGWTTSDRANRDSSLIPPYPLLLSIHHIKPVASSLPSGNDHRDPYLRLTCDAKAAHWPPCGLIPASYSPPLPSLWLPHPPAVCIQLWQREYTATLDGKPCPRQWIDVVLLHTGPRSV